MIPTTPFEFLIFYIGFIPLIALLIAAHRYNNSKDKYKDNSKDKYKDNS